MEGGPLLSDWWVEDSKNYVLYLNITSHVASHPDQGMLQAKGGNAFPYVVFMDAGGEVLTTFRPASRDALKAADTAARDLAALKAKVKEHPDDRNAKALLLMANLRLKGSESAREELAKLMDAGELDAKTVDAYKRFTTREQILAFLQEAQKEMRGVPRDQREAKNAELQAKALAKWKEGLVPAEAGNEYLGYLLNVVQGAIKAKDKAVAEAALKPLKLASESIESLREPVTKLEGEIAQL